MSQQQTKQFKQHDGDGDEITSSSSISDDFEIIVSNHPAPNRANNNEPPHLPEEGTTDRTWIPRPNVVYFPQQGYWFLNRHSHCAIRITATVIISIFIIAMYGVGVQGAINSCRLYNCECVVADIGYDNITKKLCKSANAVSFFDDGTNLLERTWNCTCADLSSSPMLVTSYAIAIVSNIVVLIYSFYVALVVPRWPYWIRESVQTCAYPLIIHTFHAYWFFIITALVIIASVLVFVIGGFNEASHWISLFFLHANGGCYIMLCYYPFGFPTNADMNQTLGENERMDYQF
eukprot:TRINITY_DN9080_c0_g1_i1.p1 TRINITY_DN9080_c0_g1~~TRINITY_DN9080_c0_g1_i1.p1  ORF type:complete len:290 (+),score=24.96 TRINITY_DN9080_c0_g1_i1:14-883(+)